MWDAILGGITGGVESGLGSMVSGALGGLFGGSKGPSAAKQLNMQRYHQYQMAENLPAYQVNGLRIAGLNPMLAATKGLPGGAAPQMGTVDDRSIDVQSSSARTVATKAASDTMIARRQLELNQAATNADIEVKEATRDYIEAQTLTELNRPENVASATGLNRALAPKAVAETAESEARVPLHIAQTNTATAHGLLMKQQALTEVQKRGLIMAETSLTRAMDKLNVTKELQEQVLTKIKDMDFHVAKQAAQEAANKNQISPTTLGKILSSINLWAKAIQGK